MSCIAPLTSLWRARNASSAWAMTSTMALPMPTTSRDGAGMALVRVRKEARREYRKEQCSGKFLEDRANIPRIRADIACLKRPSRSALPCPKHTLPAEREDACRPAPRNGVPVMKRSLLLLAVPLLAPLLGAAQSRND